MQLRALLSGSAIYLVASVLAAGLPFLLLPILTRYLSPAEFGLVGIFQGLYIFFLATCGLSVAGAIVRQSYDVDREGIAVYIFNALLILAATTSVFMVVIWAFGGQLSAWLQIPSEYFYLALVAAAMVFVLNILLGQFQVGEQPVRYGVFQVGHSLLNISLSLVGVVILSAGAMGRVGGIVVAAIAAGLVGLLVLRRIGRLSPRFNSGDVKSALRFGIPLLPHELGTFLLNWLSLFVLNTMLSASHVGIYLLAFQVSMVLGVICDAFNRAYVPWLFSILKTGDADDRASVVRLTYVYFGGLCVVVLLGFALSPWFVSLAFGRSYADAAWMIGWLLLGQALGGAYLMVTNYIVYARRTELLSAITIFANAVNIIVLFTLVPAVGVAGAIIGFVLTRALIFLLTWACSVRLVAMPWLTPRVAQ